jgi:hypothetical protein
MIHCYSILSIMLHLLHYTVLAHLLEHVVSYDKFVTAYCQLCHTCNSKLSVMIHCYSILSVMIYLLQHTVSNDISVKAYCQLWHSYNTLSVMRHLSQHTISYDKFATAHSQLRWTCHSTPSCTIRLLGDHPNKLQTWWF